MASINITNLKLIGDSNKGFKKAMKRGNVKMAEIYLMDIVSRAIDLIDQNEELENLGCSTVLTYTETDGSTTNVTFDIYSEYRDFFYELNEMIEDITD